MTKGLLALALAISTSLPTSTCASSTPRAHSAVATLSAYPEYAGDLASTIKGTVVVKDTDAGISVFGTIGGAEASAAAGIHIHTGVSCADTDQPGGHYYPNMDTDPWLVTTYTTDAAGGASVDLSLSGFSLGETNPVAGRVVVVHDASGSRIACGVLESTAGEIVQLGTYPEYTGVNPLTGTFLVTNTESNKKAGIKIQGTLAGAEASASGGFHIHSGYSCEFLNEIDEVGGHYDEGMPSDPWDTVYTSDASGSASVLIEMDEFSLYKSYPVAYRTVVAHLTAGTKAGCGIIGSNTKSVATLAAYPGTSETVVGTVVVEETTDGIWVYGTWGNGEVSLTDKGVHIHEGGSCDNADDVGGHYFGTAADDPWLTTYYSSNDKGIVSLDLSVAGFTLGGSAPVNGRTVVVHDSSGARIACGVLNPIAGEVVSLGAYPGYSGDYASSIVGTITVSETSTGIKIDGHVGGTEPSVTAGVHVHSGYTCDVTADATGAATNDASVGGHLYEMMDDDPWDTTYNSDSNGFATVDLELAGFSVQSSLGLPTAYRTFVVHTTAAKIGCGIVGTPSTAVAAMTPYPGYTDSTPYGTIAVTETNCGGISVYGTLTGLESSAEGGIHIHSGTSCASTDGPAGHYYPDMEVDPWLVTTYTSNTNGVATVSLELDSFSLTGTNPVAGRTVVVHNAAGGRVACGVLDSTAGEVVNINSYPDYAAADYSSVTGTALVEPCAMGIEIKATIAGVEPSTTGGFHIHSGYTVDSSVDANGASTTNTGVGGHFWEYGSDPWNAPVVYSADANGAAQFSKHMENFTMDEGAPVAYHTMVVHLATGGTRAGAGLIATVAPGDSSNDCEDDTVYSGDCSEGCATCDGAGESDCSSCSDGFELVDGTCTVVVDDHDHDHKDDDDDEVCFSGDSTVQLASGATKTMADLQVGDSVLSADAAGKLSYSDVAFLPHGANAKAADFVKVTTESGKAVKATPTHLLVSCDGSLAQAKAAVCLRTVNGNEAVASIETFKANGIYSAVTLDNEYLVVDGVVASPFALAHGLVNAYYNLHRAVYKKFPSLMKMPAVVSANSLLASGAVMAMNAVAASEKK